MKFLEDTPGFIASYPQVPDFSLAACVPGTNGEDDVVVVC